MATNDVNLQVINSMTQEKMNSLKNSEGKIPELANQIIMTDDEDVNLSQLRTKILWTNPNPTSSFASQTITISSNDYDYLVLIPTHNIANQIKAPACIMPKGTGGRIVSADASSNSTYIPMVMARDVTRVSDTQFTISSCRYNYGSTYTETRNDLLVPYQIIGLYKQPAMIYTGAELFAGDDIKIENGIISSDARSKYARKDLSNLTVNEQIYWRNLWWEGAGITLNKEDGIISSNIPHVVITYNPTSNQSVTGSSSSASTKTIASEAKTLPAGTYLCYVGGVIKTSSYTGDLILNIDGTTVKAGMTNLTSYVGVSNSGLISVSEGYHTIAIGIRSRATVTLPAYSTCCAFLIRVGD